MFKNIIVGIDGSKQSQTAIKIACDMAKQNEAKLCFVHVPHAETAAFVVGAVAGYHAAIMRPSTQEIEQAGEKILSQAVEVATQMKCKTVETQMLHGDAAAEILKHADDIGADLIVTGRRGLSDVSSFVLGSTTRRINHLAKCACLSVA